MGMTDTQTGLWEAQTGREGLWIGWTDRVSGQDRATDRDSSQDRQNLWKGETDRQVSGNDIHRQIGTVGTTDRHSLCARWADRATERQSRALGKTDLQKGTVHKTDRKRDRYSGQDR